MNLSSIGRVPSSRAVASLELSKREKMTRRFMRLMSVRAISGDILFTLAGTIPCHPKKPAGEPSSRGINSFPTKFRGLKIIQTDILFVIKFTSPATRGIVAYNLGLAINFFDAPTMTQRLAHTFAEMLQIKHNGTRMSCLSRNAALVPMPVSGALRAIIFVCHLADCV